jgi:nitroreductase
VGFIDLVRKRRSVRSYRPDPVPAEQLDYVLEAARLAPSWANGQCCSYLVVTDERVKHELGQAGNEWIAQAPVIVVICADPKQSGTKGDQPYYLLDAGIAMEHLVLAAAEQGLGTCWIGWFDEEKARKALGVPEGVRIVASTPLGYPNEDPGPRPRKSLAELVHHDRWG